MPRTEHKEKMKKEREKEGEEKEALKRFFVVLSRKIYLIFAIFTIERL